VQANREHAMAAQLACGSDHQERQHDPDQHRRIQEDRLERHAATRAQLVAAGDIMRMAAAMMRMNFPIGSCAALHRKHIHQRSGAQAA
jgi:hypothetical protein